MRLDRAAPRGRAWRARAAGRDERRAPRGRRRGRFQGCRHSLQTTTQRCAPTRSSSSGCSGSADDARSVQDVFEASDRRGFARRRPMLSAGLAQPGARRVGRRRSGEWRSAVAPGPPVHSGSWVAGRRPPRRCSRIAHERCLRAGGSGRARPRPDRPRRSSPAPPRFPMPGLTFAKRRTWRRCERPARPAARVHDRRVLLLRDPQPALPAPDRARLGRDDARGAPPANTWAWTRCSPRR